ncbi:MAG TPA: UDP-N-acetylmuramoyl-L-alanyl-D-glutamate--2,6-diaminopimelate ligase [Gemmatimonadales bacterium]|jgi:UDP-N-acetylmuramoyl-L-alanyl-D-glutamate--2,6-diaminopimelate ligase|nr:UDP-N-acetylmuramoyl-L-alanyl-D-glutamate--2,6-diaminopimelate ligase [Gemmatimonadales bacterium]
MNPAGLLAALRHAGLLRQAPAADALPPLSGLTTDSRSVTPGSLFVAVRGTQADGHRFVGQAVAGGAVAVAVEARVETPVPQLVVRDGRLAAIALARAWYGDPAAELQLIGITGTNGKTTTTGLLAHLLNRSGDAGSIGTLGAFDATGARVPSAAGSLTTPGPVELHASFAALRERGVRRVAMEASSHSLDQGRLDGLVFAAAVFTNLTQDHLDYHRTMEEYLAAKLRLLGLLGKDAVLAVNADDPAWLAIPRRSGTVSFGFAPTADLRATLPALGAAGSRFRLEGRFGIREVELPLPGEFNIANALAAAAVALGLGGTLAEVVERLADAPQIPGRMERLVAEPFTVLRDYAHTPDALARALAALRPLTRGRLIVLFGCGGDRDRGKRPLMGRLAGARADFTVVTSDNPRTEDPEAIIDDVMGGLPPGAPHLRLADRRAAIRAALDFAEPGDTLLLAGKGHETYQVIGAQSLPFDERAIVAELLGAGKQDAEERGALD